jgi:hypothetical protein
VVLARTTHEWNRLVELLDIDKVQTEHGKIGIGRGILASDLIDRLEAVAEPAAESTKEPNKPQRRKAG